MDLTSILNNVIIGAIVGAIVFAVRQEVTNSGLRQQIKVINATTDQSVKTADAVAEEFAVKSREQQLSKTLEMFDAFIQYSHEQQATNANQIASGREQLVIMQKQNDNLAELTTQLTLSNNQEKDRIAIRSADLTAQHESQAATVAAIKDAVTTITGVINEGALAQRVAQMESRIDAIIAQLITMQADIQKFQDTKIADQMATVIAEFQEAALENKALVKENALLRDRFLPAVPKSEEPLHDDRA